MAIENAQEAANQIEKENELVVAENNRIREHQKEIKKLEIKRDTIKMVKTKRIDLWKKFIRLPLNIAGCTTIGVLLMFRREIPVELWETIR